MSLEYRLNTFASFDNEKDRDDFSVKFKEIVLNSNIDISKCKEFKFNLFKENSDDQILNNKDDLYVPIDNRVIDDILLTIKEKIK